MGFIKTISQQVTTLKHLVLVIMLISQLVVTLKYWILIIMMISQLVIKTLDADYNDDIQISH